MAGDGCDASCACESAPCQFTVSSSVRLASVVSALHPGATLTLASGSYKGSGVCGWRLPSGAGAGDSPITVRGPSTGAAPVVDCDHVGPVVDGVLRGVHLRLEGILFTNAYISGGSGGIARAELGSRIVVANCRFSASSTDRQGGAIFVRHSNSSVVISDL